jgi:hypothetical protein
MTDHNSQAGDCEVSTTDLTRELADTAAEIAELRETDPATRKLHETVPLETRLELLDRHNNRCQTCGREGPKAGGLATLEAHHIDRDREDEHALSNLLTLCRPCHSWFHQQPTREDAPVELSEADRSVLLSQDIEILQYLAEDGPARTGAVAAAVTPDLTDAAVRERLWVLMGLDNTVEDRDQQLVDKDVETNKWGLYTQIEISARGYLPSDPKVLVQRVEDERVRQALARGCSREQVAEAYGISTRCTFNKQKRARAFDIPLDAISGRGRERRGYTHQSQHG